MNKRPLYIFDLDGTLALIDHRRGLLADKTNPNRWDEFYDACFMDKPNKPVISVMEAIRNTDADIWFFSGRTDRVRVETEQWLIDNTSFSYFELESILMMRPNGDYTPDHELKKRWLDLMLTEDRDRLVAVFDDRQRVVDMWRENGVTCFQVAPGAF